ncbi:MAG: chitobiase/beta-hexosaminidase C-terminal domain-containing protein [Muribaculaceae bacterium]|nr:chitobiase/beta-hexosaminidase C-terminal domain-containing protein [Muribaculaceae bacterium]
MRLLKKILPLLVLLLWSAAARAADDTSGAGGDYTLTTRCIPENGGRTSSGGKFTSGSTVYLTATPSTGFRFVRWEDEDGNELSASTSLRYPMPANDVTLIARFVYDPTNPEEPSTPVFPIESQIDFVVNPAGAGRISQPSGKFEAGTNQSFYAYANTGFRFLNWTQDGEIISTSSRLDYAVPIGDRTLVANFEYDPTNPEEPDVPHVYRRLNLVSNPKGAASVYGAGEYMEGSSQYVYIYTSNYSFINWTDENGEVVSESSSFYYTMPDRDVTLTANLTYNPTAPGEPGTTPSVETVVASPRISMYDDTHVQILCSTARSTIHYTLDGTDPTAASPVYTEPVYVSNNIVVKAIAYREGLEDSPVVSYQVSAYKTGAPVFTFENKAVKITSTTPGAVIRYTLDLTQPNTESQIYTTPFLPEENSIFLAYASKEGLADSPVTFYLYRSADYALPAPTFSLSSENELVITPPVKGGVTRYTIDGTDPDENSTVYTGPFTPTGNFLVKAYTTHINYFDSPIAEFQLTGFKIETPVIEKYDGSHVQIICGTSGAAIHYTLDGTDPTAESAVYTEPLFVDSDLVIKAIACKDGQEDSDIASYQVTVESAPAITADYRNRLVNIAQADNRRIELTIDGETTEAETPYTLDVVPGMSHISVVTIADDANRYNSYVNTFEIVFHKAPELRFDGHELTATPAADDPMAEDAEAVIVIADETVGAACVLTDFGTYPAHVESDRAFRSDDSTIDIDVFNSGLVAGARNGHRLQEAFGTWGDRPEDYDYLIITGKAEKADLEFLATLPELTILQLNPAEVTTENCDSIFAGTRIETINSTGYPEGMLKGMRRLTTVMWWRTDSVMPEGRIAEAANPNLLFWTLDPANAPSDARNIVEIVRTPDWSTYTGVADTIRLEAGYPFKANSSIAAKLVEVTKQFDATTEPGVCRGWETITLPFTPDRIVHENGTEIVPFDAWSGTDDAPKPFWLYTANGSDWEPASAIEAEMPYIISMPNNHDYIEDYNLAGEITFSASDVTISTEAPQTTQWKESLIFNGTFMPVEEDGVLSLNTNGEVNGVPGSLFTAEARTLPFGAYVTGAGSRRNIPVFGDEQTGLPGLSAYGLTVDSPAPGTIRISSMHDCRVTVAAATGATVAVVDIRRGETALVEGLVRGVYIAAGMKVIVK